MAKKQQITKGLSGETTKVNLFYDGDKYKDPVFVGINGMNWLIKRGVEVEVPVEVAEVINQSLEQDKRTSQLIASMAKDAEEVIGE